MELEMNWAETKNIIVVGRRDRVMKAMTSFVLILAPMTPLLLSNTSLTRFLTVRKRSNRRRTTLMLINEKTRMESEMGKS
jgi:hypothetical protein